MTTKITEKNISNLANAGVDWQSVITGAGGSSTAVSGKGYFIDTSGGTHTLNLPASPNIGEVVKVSLITSGNTLTIGRNGNNINGDAADLTISNDGDAYELVYSNASEGWKSVSNIVAGAFITATGGTVTTSGDFKIHTFTGDGCFAVSSTGNIDINPAGGPSTVDYLVVAGGGAGGPNGSPNIWGSGAGGAGGFRESKDSTVSSPHTASPLAATTGITITATTYPVTVGAGGSALTTPCSGNPGSNSVFSTITSTGGGGGGAQALQPSPNVGKPGGSGGGGAASGGPGGSGNTPPVSPSQGFGGGTGNCCGGAGGGGGATAVGGNGSGCSGGNGGAGATTSISGSPTAYAGGGGGGGYPGPGGSGGSGGGGAGGTPGPQPGSTGVNGTSNTGGGGGGSSAKPAPYVINGSAGGKGIVIIRYKYQ